MDSGKAERLQKHRKEMQRKAFLNVTVVMLLVTGLGLYVGGYAADLLFMLTSVHIAVFGSAVFVGSIIVLWSLPLLHYREELVIDSDKGSDYHRDKALEKTSLVRMLEQQGWEEVKQEDDRIVLETFPSIFHKLIRSKKTLILEQESEEDGSEVSTLRTRKNEISKIKTEYEDKEEGARVTETTVSRSRVSPVYLEVTMYLLPEMEQLIEETGEEGLEVVEENVDVGLGEYDF